MRKEILAVTPETLLVDLPPVPEWFERELSKIATKNGKPMFKIVDGQRELKWRNGKMDVKHLLQHNNVPAYVPVVRQLFRRKYKDTTNYKVYSSWSAAKNDPLDALLDQEIDFTNLTSVRAVGRACWVIEVYISPEEIGYDNWEHSRYADLQTNGVVRRVDVLGPFPREGMYMYCFSVLDDEGNAVSPSERTLDECRKRWQSVQSDTASLEQNIKNFQEANAKFEEKEVKRIADNVYQFHGISAKRWHYGEISKPITKVYE